MNTRRAPRLHADLDAVVALFPADIRKRGVERAYEEYLQLLKTVEPVFGELGPNVRVLDLGAGAGIVPMTLALGGASVTVMDQWTLYAPSLDNQMGDAAGILARFAQLDIAAVTGDVTQSPLPFGDASQDLVLLLSVIEHLHESPAALLGEIRRVLRPGGYLVVTTPNGANLQSRLRLLLGRSAMAPIESWYYDVPFSGHIREFTLHELSKMLQFADFEVVLKYLSESPRRNTPLGHGQWRRGLSIKRPSHIARVAYHALVYLVPGLRYACILIARRSNTVIESLR